MDSLKPSHFFSGYFWIYRAIKPMDYDQLKREKNQAIALHCGGIGFHRDAEEGGGEAAASPMYSH